MLSINNYLFIDVFDDTNKFNINIMLYAQYQ